MYKFINIFFNVNDVLVNCGVPMSPTDGSVGNYEHTREGATAVYQCNDGFRPSDPVVSTCTNTAEWKPFFNCTLVTGK